jgi:hypothetical protein
MALMSNGTVRASGFNSKGQLGNNTTTNCDLPITVSGLDHVKAISGGKHSLALLSKRQVRAWGYTGEGELTDRTIISRPTLVTSCDTSGCPTPLAGEEVICAGVFFSLANPWHLRSHRRQADHGLLRLADGDSAAAESWWPWPDVNPRRYYQHATRRGHWVYVVAADNDL